MRHGDMSFETVVACFFSALMLFWFPTLGSAFGLAACAAGAHTRTEICRYLSVCWIGCAIRCAGCSWTTISSVCACYFLGTLFSPNILVFPEAAERRRDPNLNDSLYTYSELEAYYRSVIKETGECYTLEEIRQYWEEECTIPKKQKGSGKGKVADLPTPARLDLEFLSYVDKRMNQRRIPLTDAVTSLCRHALQCQPQIDGLLAEKQREWEVQRTLDCQMAWDGSRGLGAYREPMLALYLNTLQKPPIFKAWRVASQWSPERHKCADEAFGAAMNWMVWLDQALSLLPTMNTEAWRVAGGFRYDDVRSSYRIGSRVVWYFPYSCTLNVDAASQIVQQSDGVSTLYHVKDFQGHDIQFLSAFPGECEAMTRAASSFIVENVEVADLASENPLMWCDRVTLRQCEMQRRDPIKDQALNAADIQTYKNYVTAMNALELYNENFKIRWEDFKQVTEAQLHNAYRTSAKLSGFSFPMGTKGISLEAGFSKGGEDCHFYSTFVAFQKDAADKYRVIICSAEQTASFDEVAFNNKLKQLVQTHQSEKEAGCRQEVREEEWANLGWMEAASWMFSSWKSFDKSKGVGSEAERRANLKAKTEADSEMSALKFAQRKIAFVDCLSGFILHEAQRTGRIALDSERPDHYRLQD